jgi:hypothetical protein
MYTAMTSWRKDTKPEELHASFVLGPEEEEAVIKVCARSMRGQLQQQAGQRRGRRPSVQPLHAQPACSTASEPGLSARHTHGCATRSHAPFPPSPSAVLRPLVPPARPACAVGPQHYSHFYHKTDRFGRPLYIELLGQSDVVKILEATSMERLISWHVVEWVRRRAQGPLLTLVEWRRALPVTWRLPSHEPSARPAFPGWGRAAPVAARTSAFTEAALPCDAPSPPPARVPRLRSA